MQAEKKSPSEFKRQGLAETKNIALVLLGCAILAFADAVFLVPCQIVSGGVTSLGIIINFFVEPLAGTDVTDIVVWIAMAVLWLVGLFTLGPRFSFNTLLGSIAFPAFFSLMTRFDLAGLIGVEKMYAANSNQDGTLNLAVLMLSGVFGGGLAGAGVAISYLGNGSTGGFDVISFIIAKYTEVKQDVSGFIIDSTLIVIGIICMRDWELGLVGILSAFSCAMAVQFIYIYLNSCVIVDIISDRYPEIQSFIHHELDHATTLIDTVGGYTGQKRKMIRVVIYRAESNALRNFIASVDPKAFVSFTQAKTINGEGFEPFASAAKGRKKLLRRLSSAKPDDNGKA